MADTVISLEAQVVETHTEAKRRLIKRRLRLTPRSPPLAPFFIFMKDFRITYFYEENHDYNFHDYSSLGSKRWRSLTEDEKNLYCDIASELEAEYNNKPQMEHDDFAIVNVEDEEKQSNDVEEKQAHEENVKNAQDKEEDDHLG